MLYLGDEAEVSHALVDLASDDLFEHFRLLLIIHGLLSVCCI